jgi:4-hydroxy-tetrahydrodipicolinate synthase
MTSKAHERRLSTFCCSITPFAASGALDEAALRRHLRRLCDAGVGVYLAGSSPGEGYALSPAEVERILRIGVEELGGRVPVRAMGVEPRRAAEMVEFAKRAAGTGADAIQIYSLDMGHGGKPTADTLERYFRTCLDAIALPCVVSSHYYVGYTLPVEFMDALVNDYPQLIGFNVTSPEIPYLSRVCEALADRVEIHVGGPMHALTALALGGHGYLSTESNTAPALCQSVISHSAAGRHTEARAAYARVMRLMAGTQQIPGMSVRYVKACLSALGFEGTHTRDPHLPITPAETACAAKWLAALGLAAES